MLNLSPKHFFVTALLFMSATQSAFSQSMPAKEIAVLNDTMMAERYKLNIYLMYPDKARDNDIQGTVILTFDVDSACDVINRQVAGDTGYGLNKAALYALDRVARELKKEFKSCKSFSGNLPVIFKLQ